MDVEGAPGNGDVSEFHPWNPHKAAKDIEVGDYYFKERKNYRAAADRYREALALQTRMTQLPPSAWPCAWKNWISPTKRARNTKTI